MLLFDKKSLSKKRRQKKRQKPQKTTFESKNFAPGKFNTFPYKLKTPDFEKKKKEEADLSSYLNFIYANVLDIIHGSLVYLEGLCW